MSVNALGIIFSNIHDEELNEITKCRTMGSLPFGGRYRLIDFALSNMHNSGVTSVGVIAKNNYQSLIDHLGSGKEWDLSRKREGLFIFPPFGRFNSGFYKNKVEALYGIIDFIKKSSYDYILLTDCDVICNLDWKVPLAYHISKKADITIAYFYKNPEDDSSNDKTETIYPVSKDGFVTDILLGQKLQKRSCVGTNIWIIGKNQLETILEDAMAHNLENIERDVFQKKLNSYKIAAWEFDGFIRKINSLNDFFHANLDLLNPSIRKELFSKNGQINTKVLDDIPAFYGSSSNVSNSLIADGCLIEGSVENSILFSSVHVGKNSRISNSIIMQDSKIGENVNLDYVLADKKVIFNDNRTLVGYNLRPIYIKKGSNV